MDQNILRDYATVTELDGQPFAIFDSWEDVSASQDHINSTLIPSLWNEYRPIYEACARFQGRRYPFSELRLGQLNLDLYDDSWRTEYNPEKLSAWYLLREKNLAVPSMSKSPYMIPEGLWTIEGYMKQFMDADEYNSWGFSDEYSTCDECYSAIRTSPDCYQWQPDYVEQEWRGYICKECVLNDTEEYIEDYIAKPLDKMVPPFFNLEEMKFSRVPVIYENGWHAHMNDVPKDVLKFWRDKLKSMGVDKDEVEFVFAGSVSQFYVDFSLWVRPGDLYSSITLKAISDITKATGEYA